MMTPVTGWKEMIGKHPHRVTVWENVSRGSVLYLRWTENGKTVTESLAKQLRTSDGRIIKDTQKWARAQATSRYNLLASTGGRMPVVTEVVDEPAKPLTIAETFEVVSDPAKGKYPRPTPHRAEVETALKFAARVWGAGREWNTIRRSDIRQLGRARVDDLRANGAVGYRGAEITLQRILAISKWLRDEEQIDEASAIAARDWREELRGYWADVAGEPGIPEPSRPRHSLEELRMILAKASQVDPRLGLLLEIGAEGRGGQVRRIRRTNLELDHKPHGRVVVKGKGKKKGLIIHLTAAQRAAIEHAFTAGYLRKLEMQWQSDRIDYPLFPAGQMPGGRKGVDPVADPARHAKVSPCDMSSFREWFKAAERLAGVPVIEGRVLYGIRRGAVDAAKSMGISREGLQAQGGWKDSQMPDRVYADQTMEYAQEEARKVRDKIRGKTDET